MGDAGLYRGGAAAGSGGVRSLRDRRPWRVAAILALCFTLAGTALIVWGRMPSRVAYDQKLYHAEAIAQFVREWPRFDFWHYLSATTPGYHVLMAGVEKIAGPSVFVKQAVAVGITAALLVLLGWLTGRRAGWLFALLACGAFAGSRYVVDAGVWLLPDNLGWLGVLSVLVIALRRKVDAGWLLAGAAIVLLLVFARQIHLWTAGLLWAAAWLKDDQTHEAAALRTWREVLWWNWKAQVGRTAIAVAATIPAFVLIALFDRYWDGLVPPVFQGWYKGVNPSGAVLALATFGMYGVFFAPVWWPGIVRMWRDHRAWLLGFMLAGAVYLVAVPTNFEYEAGRRSGLWNLAGRLPQIGGHSSVLMIGLGLMGCLSLCGLMRGLWARERMICIAAVAGFIAANMFNSDLFQRYVDPFVLMMLAVVGCTVAGTHEAMGRNGRLRVIGTASLCLGLTLMTVAGVVRGTVGIHDPPPPARSPDDTSDVIPPAIMPRPEKPAGKTFW